MCAAALAPGAAVALKSQPLLYVAHAGEVAIVSLRTGKTLASITGFGSVGGVCAGSAGEVWGPNSRNGVWYVDKFEPGSMTHVQEFRERRASFLVACAVNPNNGDVAAAGYDKNGAERVWIWGAHGKPATYKLTSCPLNAAYDASGDVFISGWACGSTFNPYLTELVSGGSAFETIRLDKSAGPLGGVQWDGTYVTLAVSSHFHSELFRVQVSGNSGTVVGTVHLAGFNVCCWGTPTGLFALDHGMAIGEAGNDSHSILEWKYPGGGKSLRTIGSYAGIDGIAVSLPPT